MAASISHRYLEVSSRRRSRTTAALGSAAAPVVLDRADVARALSSTSLRNDDLLIQR